MAETLTKFRGVVKTRKELREALARLDRAEIARRQRRIFERRVVAAQRAECRRFVRGEA